MGYVLPIIIRTFTLFFIWMFLSGYFDAIHLTLGFFCSLLIAFVGFPPINSKSSLENIKNIHTYLLRGFCYLVYLMKSIVLAAIHVSQVILDPKMPIDPKFIRHKTILTTDTRKVIFGNSITLTPGTITADISDDILTIHQLDDASAGDIINCNMENEINKIFGIAPKS